MRFTESELRQITEETWHRGNIKGMLSGSNILSAPSIVEGAGFAAPNAFQDRLSRNFPSCANHSSFPRRDRFIQEKAGSLEVEQWSEARVLQKS